MQSHLKLHPVLFRIEFVTATFEAIPVLFRIEFVTEDEVYGV